SRTCWSASRSSAGTRCGRCSRRSRISARRWRSSRNGGRNRPRAAMEVAFRRFHAPALVMSLAALLGLSARVAPCVREPGFHFMLDGQYHERLTRQPVTSGHLAELDSLSNAPDGRHTADHLPTGLYVAGALLHRALAAVGIRELRWSLAILQAMAGALIA